jgi:hypothetical protein
LCISAAFWEPARGAIIKSAITLDHGKVVQGNFDNYQALALNEMPHVDVFIVARTNIRPVSANPACRRLGRPWPMALIN